MNAGNAMAPRRRIVPALGAATVAAVLGGLGLAAPLDDAVQRWLAPRTASPAAAPSLVLLVGPEDPWPWSSARLAGLLDRLRGAGARGVGLDLPLRAGVDPAGDARLARTLIDNRVALGVPLSAVDATAPQARMPPVEFADAARLGHLLLPRDRDGRIREHLAYVVTADGVRWPSLVQALARPGSALGGRPADHWRVGALADSAVPPTLPAAGVLDGSVGASQLQGRWILVGLGDPALQPRLRGPSGSPALFPVEHQARALAALLQDSTPRPLPVAMQAMTSILLAGMPVLLGLSGGWRGRGMAVALLAGLALPPALCAWLLGRQFWFAPGGAMAVLGTGLLAWIATVLGSYLRRQRSAPGGLVSRRCLDAALQDARDAGRPHALLLFELDAAGPAAQADVCRLATLLRERARRPGDVAAHLGGGRFALLLPGMPVNAAEQILDQLRGAAALELPGRLEASVHGCRGEGCDCERRLAGAQAPA